VAVADDRGVGPAPEFERQPPQDIQAEQSVLGGMLLSKDAIADVVEVLRSGDFYRPAHQIIYDTVLDLYGRGEPADPVTVAAELTRSGQLMRVGGAPYIHTLMSSVPTAANAGYYAEIVAERAVLRRLVEAGTRIVQLGYGAASGQGGDVDEVVDRAQAEIYDVTERRMSEDYVRLEQLLQGTMDEIDAISSRGGASIGVPTGFAELDQITNGLHGGQMIVVAARPAIGKALALDTPLPTPSGWTTMGEVRVGDELIDADGRPTRVVGATEVLHDRPCYELTFSDGTTIVADAQHQWRTTTRAARRAAAERRSSRHYWTHAAIERVDAVATAAPARPDRPVTMRALTADVGPEFRHVPHTVGRMVGSTGRVPVEAAGAHRGYRWHAPAYSSREITAALTERVCRPAGDWAAGDWAAAEHEPILTTEQIAATLRPPTDDRRWNHAVTVAAPLRLPDRDLPLAPYTLGAWLGDGASTSASLTSADPEILDAIRADGYRVTAARGNPRYRIQLPPAAEIAARPCVVCGEEFVPRPVQVRTCGRSCGGRARVVSAPVPPAACPDCGGAAAGLRRCQACHDDHGSVLGILRSMGVLGDKHIPGAYLRASEAQRRALLAGLLDTDGTVTKAGGAVELALTNRRLAEGAHELILSLGYRATLRTEPVIGRSAASSTCYMINFTPTDPVFRLSRKAARCVTATRSTGVRYIVGARQVPSVPVRCVQVDNADHLYLASRSMIPTHNSTLGLDFARSCSIKNGLTSVIFSLEMSRSEITMRLLSAEAKVALHHMRSGHMSDDDWARLARRMGEVADAPLYIDDSPNLTMMEIRAKARRLRQRNDLRLVVIDYLQLMTSGKRVESRQQEVSEFSRSLKLLAKELEVPVVGISQLNRGPEQRQDKKPMLSDLRESGSIEQDADMVLLLHREDAYERESPRAGEADLILAKHRNGPTGVVTVAFQGHYSRFVDMAG
jgi:replicative DNA helicase